MDGVHIPASNNPSAGCKVLILVVMDGVHILLHLSMCLNCFRLNPCCNGWCTHTHKLNFMSKQKEGLNPCCNGWCTHTWRQLQHLSCR